jgi:hypothetical protein
LHNGRRDRVRLEAAEPLPVGGLARVRVRSCVGQAIPVGRAAAQEAPFARGLGRHGGPNSVLDAHAFALAHPAEDRHDHVVGFTPWIHGASDFRDPERDAVVLEDREGEAELVAVERAVRFSDDHGIETSAGVSEGVQEACRLGPALPWDRPTVADVEVLSDDLTSGRLDQLACQGLLPTPR